jgi:hypothetical protein
MRRFAPVLLLVTVVSSAGAAGVTAVDRATNSGQLRRCPLEEVKLPGVQYVGQPLNHKSIPQFSDTEVEGMAEVIAGGWNVCFSISKDGKKLLAYAFPTIALCEDGSGHYELVEGPTGAVPIQKNGRFSAGTSSSFFKGRILPGGKTAAGTLRDNRRTSDSEAKLCDTGIVRWTASKVASR